MSLLRNQLAGVRRCILARLQPKEGGGVDKIPTNPATGYDSNAQDASTWLTFDEAQEAADAWNAQLVAPVMGYGVGIMLGAGFWCIDLDHCREGDGWAPRAVAVVQRFPGAYVEVSQSLESLHVMGFAREFPLHGTRCKALGAECYSERRFIYTTGIGAAGDIRTDLTPQFMSFATQYFPKDEASDEAQWGDKPVPEWQGPADDAELIARALRSISANAAFGGKARFRDLWEANADALAKTFPPYGSSTWDGSGADQALANHLAFWTGKNPTRIAKLMRESKLVRSKWERADYFQGTILKACADQKEVYHGPTDELPPSQREIQHEALSMTLTLTPNLVPPPPTDIDISNVPPPPTDIEGAPPPPPLPTIPHAMTFNSKDQYEATLGNLVHVLTVQPQARIGYDEFRACIMIAPMGTEEWQRLTDTNMIELRHKIEVIQGFAPIGRELMRDSLQLLAERHKFDSAATWLDGLVWDGVPRISNFMSAYCGSEDSEYTRAVSMYMWSGLAGRLFEPGCQLDMVIAMQSPQGRKKSTGFRLLAPNPDAFTDGISLQHDDDNFKRLLRGKCIVEIAEMAGLSKADNDVVKRVITRRTEEWIEKYQTVPTRFDRRCMLFASTNNERFLPADETGHRRWLPIQIAELNREMIERDRDQLWAEGAIIWRTMGIQWADAERLAPERHKQYEQTDVWDAKIAEWLVTPQKRGDRTLPAPCEKSFTISDVLQGAIGMTTERMDPKAEKRAAAVLRLLDYEPRLVRVDGKQKRAWFSKLVPPPPSD